MTERHRRYPSDTSDEQWAVIEPLLPAVKTGGRPEKHARRAIVDAILYVVRTGCAWWQLPADFPPWQTVYWYFVRWEQARLRLTSSTEVQHKFAQSIDVPIPAGSVAIVVISWKQVWEEWDCEVHFGDSQEIIVARHAGSTR
jgi:hypothetical protein